MELIRKLLCKYRRGFVAFATMGGVAYAQAGCQNTEVTNTVLVGMEDLFVKLVQAFFIAITPTNNTTTPVTTWLMDGLNTLLA